MGKNNIMKKILIYSSRICPYCLAAKALFENLSLNFNEKFIDGDDKVRADMLKKSNGRKTVPQIFIGELHVGGYDDLAALHKNGELMSIIYDKKV